MRLPAAALLVLAAGGGFALSNERSAQLVNSFQVFCTLEKPDFGAIDAKAKSELDRCSVVIWPV